MGQQALLASLGLSRRTRGALLLLQWGLLGALSMALVWPFGALLAGGLGMSLVIQGIVNMGVAVGLLPGTGLTLPFVSYGGTSLIVCCAMLALVLRIDCETRLAGRRR